MSDKCEGCGDCNCDETPDALEPKEILVEKEQVETMLGFLNTIPGIQMVPCDDPMNGLKGYAVFHNRKDGVVESESSLCVCYQYAKAIPESERRVVKVGDLGDQEAEDALAARVHTCITEEGWTECSEPQALTLGFGKLEPLDSPKESRGLFLKIGAFKMLPKALRDDVDAWRKKMNNVTDQEIEAADEAAALDGAGLVQ